MTDSECECVSDFYTGVKCWLIHDSTLFVEVHGEQCVIVSLHLFRDHVVTFR